MMDQTQTKTISQAPSDRPQQSVATGLYVTIEYTMTAQDGTVLGDSRYSGPFTFRSGVGDAMPGLDRNLKGCVPGEQVSFNLLPEEAYGPRDESLVRHVPKNMLQLDREVEPGMQMSVNGTIMTVTQITDTELVLDGNHPLAGVPLHLEATVLNVSAEAPAEHHDCTCGGTCDCN